MRKLIYTLALALILNSVFLIQNSEAQWQPEARLTNDPAVSYTSYNNAWCVAASGSIVHVVWSDGRDGNREVYYKRSVNDGITWGADIRLTNDPAISENPSVAVSGSVVNVAWTDSRNGNQEIYYKRSTDGGINWGVDTRLSNDTAKSEYPSVAVSGQVIHLVWIDRRNGNQEIYFKRSTDGGMNWGADTRLTNDTSYSGSPTVTVSGQVVHVVWTDRRDGNDEIYYKRSTDGGSNWGADTRMTNNTANSLFPSVTVSGSVVHVIWSDYRDGNYEIYYKLSTDEGVSWGADTRLTNSMGSSVRPSITVNGSFVHVVWEEDRDGNYEIYYKRSTNGGLNWGTDTRLTINTAYSQFSSVTISGAVIHIVWQDNRDLNFEIYYKRNPSGNPVGVININAEIPSAYSLSQNYPNPFNPTTKIKFEIPSLEGYGFSRGVGLVTLTVYDVMGREVQTLVNESLKPGTYEATFDGSALNSGVYFYKISTGDFSQTKKMTLIK